MQDSFLGQSPQKDSSPKEPFYTSGFIYSVKTHQILLPKFQQKDSTDFLWSTFVGESGDGEEAHVAFQRLISELLGLSLKAKNIYPIYDYFHDEKNKHNYIFYAEVKNPRVLNHLKGDAFSWVGFEEIAKLKFSGRAKQDIIVGQRVINAKWREDEAKKLPAFPEATL